MRQNIFKISLVKILSNLFVIKFSELFTMYIKERKILARSSKNIKHSPKEKLELLKFGANTLTPLDTCSELRKSYYIIGTVWLFLNFRMTITLYHFPPSAPSRTALLTARVLGLDIDVKEINLFKKEQLQPEFLKINPQHTVPTLNDNGFILWESRAIAGYLVRQYAKDDVLYPKNPQLKATVDQRLYFDCTTLYPQIRAICFPVLFLGETKVTEEKKKSLNNAIAFLENFLHGRKFLTSDSCTIADISAYASLSSALAIGWDISSFPNVKSWVERCKLLPGASENDEGAKMFGEAVLKNLEPGQI